MGFRVLFGFLVASTSLPVGVTPALAQDVQVSGTVTDAASGAPLEGVSVQVKGTGTHVRTSSSGEYRIAAGSAADSLVFAHLGHSTERVAVANRSVVDVALRASPIDLGELVVVPYGRNAVPRCAGFYDPMPGSVYDPHWQKAHPELARLLLGECAPEFPEAPAP